MGQIIEVIERYEIPDVPTIELPTEDGVPLESNWHRGQMNLLIDVISYQGRETRDFFVGGNMFVYYSLQQVRNRDYKGSDLFLVKGVDGTYSRDKWVVWEENGRFPDLIVELMSPSTASEDLGSKKILYEQTFRTPEYFCYDPATLMLYGWRLENMRYVPLEADSEGRMWSSVLTAWIGLWRGSYQTIEGIWLRTFTEDGQLILTEGEAERQRAEIAEAEIARLQEELARGRGERANES